ncbi:FAD/NAD(P)-binding domain-containing protein [Mycena chlorophos]|uniref:FAD/NAD(P)-binding domain-containing protein n=1 Tax=Mycena chlorophos TaxID=658473 RepID=A0A8H6RXW9_MYCCL|nr:FAD/NAD(P)-binding domain-containing protein [Mycena chlorophos]
MALSVSLRLVRMFASRRWGVLSVVLGAISGIVLAEPVVLTVAPDPTTTTSATLTGTTYTCGPCQTIPIKDGTTYTYTTWCSLCVPERGVRTELGPVPAIQTGVAEAVVTPV